MGKDTSTILERLSKHSFPMQELYTARKNAHLAPLADLILASEQIAENAREPWEYKSLAQMGREDFILTGHISRFDNWAEDAQRELADCVSRFIYFEDSEGLLFFVRGENEKYRVAQLGDAAYDFVRRLSAEESVSDLHFTKPPTWAEELFLWRENWEAYKLMWHDNSASDPLYQASKKLRADAVIRETRRRMRSVLRSPRIADLIDLVSLSKSFALHNKMTNGEACDWVTTTLVQLADEDDLLVYDISGKTLPKQIERERTVDAIYNSFNENWWCDDYQEQPTRRIGPDQVAILKEDACKYCNLPLNLLNQTVTDAIPDDVKVSGTTPPSREHVSDKLAKMNQAAAKFWARADRTDRGTQPTNSLVAAWLVEQGFSATLADKAATIIRPEWAPTGRKPEE